MRVICIKDSIPIDNNPRIILVTKNSIYNVTKVTRQELFGQPKRTWYSLLETGEGIVHTTDSFQPFYDNDDLVEIKPKEIYEQVL